ncbi:MAG: UPF0280 family protein [Desulfobacteraceae bacterium]|nr:UPF0280 family protein [Desulfobacteraceae bacterium]
MSYKLKRHKKKRPGGKEYVSRSYRRLVRSDLKTSHVAVQQTDLTIYTDIPLTESVKESVLLHRGYLESYIRHNPGFVKALIPLPPDPLAPSIVQKMIKAGACAGVGPMAAVAGSVAEQTGLDMLEYTTEILIENGGDIFISTSQPITVGVFAGQSPLSLKVGIALKPRPHPFAVCTSSGTVGHSLSTGIADAVCILGGSCSVTDAVATATGNRVQKTADIQAAIDWARRIDGVDGVLIIIGDAIGAWGQIKLVSI